MKNEIREAHVSLLENLGSVAREQHVHHRKTWRDYDNKEYGNEDFKKVEILYGEGSDMAGDMLDLINLSQRLKHFIGVSSQPISIPTVLVNNHFNSSVKGIQQNYNSENSIQNLNFSSRNSHELLELNQLAIQFKGILNNIEIDSKEEIFENIIDLEESLNEKTSKPNRIKAFGRSTLYSMKKILTMKSLQNVEEITEKLPKIANRFNELLSKIT